MKPSTASQRQRCHCWIPKIYLKSHLTFPHILLVLPSVRITQTDSCPALFVAAKVPKSAPRDAQSEATHHLDVLLKPYSLEGLHLPIPKENLLQLDKSSKETFTTRPCTITSPLGLCSISRGAKRSHENVLSSLHSAECCDLCLYCCVCSFHLSALWCLYLLFLGMIVISLDFLIQRDAGVEICQISKSEKEKSTLGDEGGGGRGGVWLTCDIMSQASRLTCELHTLVAPPQNQFKICSQPRSGSTVWSPLQQVVIMWIMSWLLASCGYPCVLGSHLAWKWLRWLQWEDGGTSWTQGGLGIYTPVAMAIMICFSDVDHFSGQHSCRGKTGSTTERHLLLSTPNFSCWNETKLIKTKLIHNQLTEHLSLL